LPSGFYQFRPDRRRRGRGGGPWLDGRVRLAHTAIGYGAKWLDATTATYANTAQTALDAFTALIADARAGRQIKG
jgi:3-methyl-2-oxobutanoate hydroxymethyltransferase